MRLTSTLVFLTMTVVGVLVAYDQPLAIRRFGLIALGLALVALLAWMGVQDDAKVKIGFAAYGCLWVAGADGGALPYERRNWVAAVDSSAPATGLLQPAAPLASIALNNATAGVLVILMPIGAASLDWLWQRRSAGDGAASGLRDPCISWPDSGFSLRFGSIATDSRGAWFALGVGTACAAYCAWRFGVGRMSALRWIGDGFLAFAAVSSGCRRPVCDSVADCQRARAKYDTRRLGAQPSPIVA